MGCGERSVHSGLCQQPEETESLAYDTSFRVVQVKVFSEACLRPNRPNRLSTPHVTPHVLYLAKTALLLFPLPCDQLICPTSYVKRASADKQSIPREEHQSVGISKFHGTQRLLIQPTSECVQVSDRAPSQNSIFKSNDVQKGR